MPQRVAGVGIVGLGRVSAVHQQAYRRYGFAVVAGFDPSPAARARFVGANSGATAYESLGALLADDRVGVVDVAVPHHREVRLPVLERVTAAGLPVLIQKPLAMTYQDAVEVAALVERAGVTTMVNQNLCFTPGAVELAQLLLDREAIGAPFLAGLQLRYLFDPGPDDWYGKDERWWTANLNVHHLALLHMLFGPPETVFAMAGRDPAQPGVSHEGYADVALHYASGLSVTFASTGTYYGDSPIPHKAEQLWVQGPGGVLDWTPEGALTLSRRDDSNDTPVRQTTTPVGRWFPDAFGFAMAHLQQALVAAKRPLCDVTDNLYVMATVEAVYMSARGGRSIRLEEVMGDRYEPAYGPGWFHGLHDWKPPEVRAEEELTTP